MEKKSQAWGMDLIVAFTIFSLGIVVFYLFTLNNPAEAKESIDTLFYEGKIISNSILSKGYPENWNKDGYVKIGILSNDKINETKLQYFYELARDDYEKTKSSFNTNYDYWFFLDEQMIINGDSVNGIGKSDFNNAKNLVKVSRFVIYKDEPVNIYLYVWEE